jgi:predicted ATPase
MIIDKFEIEGLYGNRNYSIVFDNNQLILVGENGSGKSTVVSILHYLLTSQWQKLSKYTFKSLTLVLNGEAHAIAKEDIACFEDSEYASNEIQYVIHRISELGIDPEKALKDFGPSLHRYLTEDIHLSPSALRRILKELSSKQKSLFNETPEKLLNLQEKLQFHVLFLPTYRRIERDLKTIFPALEEDIRRFNIRLNRLSDYKKHVELVEFGMHDVRVMIDNTMKSLDTKFRASLDVLTGGYLRVILRKEYEKADTMILKGIDEGYLEEILQKIDESVLSDQDQRTLRETIKRFGDIEPISDIDKLSAHIITKLILLHKSQYEREEKVRAFASVCNNYLKGKRFEFDNNNFSLPIKPHNDDSSAIVSNNNEIKLSMLSSGEKQIVSLFSHLYLSDIEDYFVIIDEPELSLSVPWQKTFLPDMVLSNKCSGLVAVTHSPFIYDNDLEDKAHSIQEFLEVNS